jgi:membrane protein DedA with SNARE-associated domain
MSNLRMSARRFFAIAMVGAILTFSAARTFGIQGLKISAQNETNIVLS